MTIVKYFSDKDLHAFVLEGRKEKEKKRKALGTCDSDDEKAKNKLCM
jgi:hypothetical protein